MTDRGRGTDRRLPAAAEVVVLGAGPGGATAAALVAEAGHDVLLLDRAAGPGFKVGESLMPATWWTLERLGLLGRMESSAFPRKHSVQFFAADGRGSAPFYFADTDPHESSVTWQVLREEFDRLLVERARELGVRVAWGVGAREVTFEDGRAVGVEVDADGARRRIGARVVVDATGQRTLIAQQLGLRRIDPRMRHAAYYTHFEGARRDEGIDEGATLIFHTEEQGSWFWFIPLPDDRASVGVVGPVERLVRKHPGGPQAVFEEELALCAALRPRLAGARQVIEMKVARDFSYRSRRAAGDGWVLVGDAYGFIDPIYSSGVFLALKSGEMAADAIVAGLAAGDLSGARLGAWEDEYREGLDAIARLVEAFYDPSFSFGRFLERFPACRDQIVRILTGDVYRRPVDSLFEALDEFRREVA